ncbi:MAG: hypothetical protein HeimC2_39580 [Candidatus Heimdallarchaeota archaeon LC_2]|nr:MAG: hypothetical protein HeimC2_39580 [Candidatus Heimdallarchaeota archaeon LC_2]
MDKENYWGRYSGEYPQVRYDPLLSHLLKNEIYGYRVHVVPGRGSRPRDHSIRKRPERELANPVDSIFYKVSKGEELSIVISSNNKDIGNFTDKPEYHKLASYNGLTIVNKYSPLNTVGDNASGVALVTYSNKYSEDLSVVEANLGILKSLKNSLQSIINSQFHSSLIFFNIGPSSGASLRQLHAQSYVIPRNSGLLSGNFQQAYDSARDSLSECLVCKLATLDKIVDHLKQELNLTNRIVWEDKNWRVIVPNAPMRALAIRIIPKIHKNWFGKLDQEEIEKLAWILHLADNLINIATPSKWPPLIDRTVVFRQSITVERDFHFFIDVLPSIPFGGSEMVDSLSITSLDPDKTAEIMKEFLIQNPDKL